MHSDYWHQTLANSWCPKAFVLPLKVSFPIGLRAWAVVLQPGNVVGRGSHLLVCWQRKEECRQAFPAVLQNADEASASASCMHTAPVRLSPLQDQKVLRLGLNSSLFYSFFFFVLPSCSGIHMPSVALLLFLSFLPLHPSHSCFHSQFRLLSVPPSLFFMMMSPHTPCISFVLGFFLPFTFFFFLMSVVQCFDLTWVKQSLGRELPCTQIKLKSLKSL